MSASISGVPGEVGEDAGEAAPARLGEGAMIVTGECTRSEGAAAEVGGIAAAETLAAAAASAAVAAAASVAAASASASAAAAAAAAASDAAAAAAASSAASGASSSAAMAVAAAAVEGAELEELAGRVRAHTRQLLGRQLKKIRSPILKQNILKKQVIR